MEVHILPTSKFQIPKKKKKKKFKCLLKIILPRKNYEKKKKNREIHRVVCTSDPPFVSLRSGRYNFIPRHVVDRKESERVPPKSMPANSASLLVHASTS